MCWKLLITQSKVSQVKCMVYDSPHQCYQTNELHGVDVMNIFGLGVIAKVLMVPGKAEHIPNSQGVDTQDARGYGQTIPIPTHHLKRIRFGLSNFQTLQLFLNFKLLVDLSDPVSYHIPRKVIFIGVCNLYISKGPNFKP